MIGGTSPIDNTAVGLGNVGAALVGMTRLLGDAGGGLVPCDGSRGVLGAVVQLLAVGMCDSDVVMSLVAFGAVGALQLFAVPKARNRKIPFPAKFCKINVAHPVHVRSS